MSFIRSIAYLRVFEDVKFIFALSWLSASLTLRIINKSGYYFSYFSKAIASIKYLIVAYCTLREDYVKFANKNLEIEYW